ncbi:hypothetical protein AUJ84_04610 [Candidatus Pacearchaeota archaeon CG1_02_32_132]|nr:MAG: hypothetical protein AUJ84_04610 [Candidatus Pacearchaeota archaeon CG1_02_32_132]
MVTEKSPLTNIPDEDLAFRAVMGDNGAFKVLFRRYQQSLEEASSRFFRDKDMVEDIVQDSFLKIWQNLNRYNSSFPFGPWATTICKNTARDYLRKNVTKKRSMIAPINETDLEFATNIQGPLNNYSTE